MHGGRKVSWWCLGEPDIPALQHNWLFCHTVPKKPAASHSIKAAPALLPQKEIIATGKKTHRRRYRSNTILFDCSSDEALASTCFLTQHWTSGKDCKHGLAQEEKHNLCGLCVFLGSRSVLPPMPHEEKNTVSTEHNNALCGTASVQEAKMESRQFLPTNSAQWYC